MSKETFMKVVMMVTVISWSILLTIMSTAKKEPDKNWTPINISPATCVTGEYRVIKRDSVETDEIETIYIEPAIK